jgi:RNA polymerase sigma-70 factor (ECF subfamily)
VDTVTRAASGDGGFDEFFESTYPRVVRALTAGLGGRVEAEDAAQEAFAKALVRWSRVRAMERPDGWVFIVAIRGARRALARADRLNGSVGHASAASLAAPGEEAGHGLTEGGLLDGLTPRERLAVLLRFHEDLKLVDVAKAMGCQVGTVKATLHSALRKLRAQLGPTVDGAVEQIEEEP